MQEKNKRAIHHISVVFKTHLDIGFTDLAARIVHRYLEDYIPAALDLARRTRESPHRFVWTTGSWLAYRFLEEAKGQKRKLMEEAIAAGDFHWHALPFTTHTELMDPPLFEAGLRFSKMLDERFGRTTTGAKMTDVPGHTCGMIPLMAQAGIRLLHIGVNPASTVPSVPPVFVWRAGEKEVVVIYETIYGGTTLLPDGLALAVNLTNDNIGPHNPAEIGRVYEKLEKRFPQAEVRAGNLSAVADHLWSRRAEFPVVTSEIGDTWIYGAGTDPAKVAHFRELNRLRNRWLAEGKLAPDSKNDVAFAEQLLLVAEHTWGLDLKTFLGEWKNYRSAEFSRVRSGPKYRKMEASWEEQRAYLRKAVAGLPAHLRKEAAGKLKELKPALPKRSGWRSVVTTQSLVLGPWTLAFHPQNGSICLLQRKSNSRQWAGTRHQLATLAYQTFSATDFERFYGQYARGDFDWAQKDFTKSGLPSTACAGWHQPRLQKLEMSRDGANARAQLCFSTKARAFGAPAFAWLRIDAEEEGIDLRLEWFDKKANRMPEALWLNFNPKLARRESWKFRKLGLWVDPQDVVRNGNRQLNAIQDEVRAGDFSMASLDAPLVAPGWGSLLDFHNRKPNFSQGIAFNLYNNIWGTNFPMWYSEDGAFRFRLRFR